MKAMTNPMQMWSAWFALSAQSAQLGWEAQNVIALRLMKLACGGARSRSEAHRMVSEKIEALVEAQNTAAAAMMSGGPHTPQAARKVLDVYRRRVRRNRRRLAR